MIILFAVILILLIAMAAYTTAVSYVWTAEGLVGWEAWTFPAALWLAATAAAFATADAWRLA